MSGTPAATQNTDSPGTLGRITSLISKALARMTPEERSVVIADAAVSSATALGKAEEMLNIGDDGTHIGMVDDLWDGPPDDRLRIGGGHGPGSTAPSGSVNVGSSQASSGNNAPRMERQYSNHAPQSGVQSATERLGRDIAGIRGAMKSMMTAFDSFNTQLEAVKASIPVIEVPDTAALVKTAVEDAVAKALAGLPAMISKSVRAEVVKAWENKDEKEGDKEEDDEAKEKADAFISKAEEKEKEEEDGKDDEKETRKSALDLRVAAKHWLKWASRRLGEAEELEESGKPKSAARHMRMARYNFAKAREFGELAKAQLGELESPKTTQLIEAIAKASKGLPAAQSENQTKWPNSADKPVGKADSEPATTIATASQPSAADLQKAMDQISKAASGFALLQANMSEVFQVMSGQSRNTGPGGDMPPVLALAKAGADELSTRENEILRMGEAGQLRFDDVDRARDVIGHLRAKVVPPEVIKAKISQLPESAQTVLLRNVA